MGLLDEVATAVAKRGSEIVDLLRSGRADEVTDAMFDMGDPVLNTRLNEYLWNNYDLPMDAASRMERASNWPTPLDKDTSHGTPYADIVEFRPSEFGSVGPGVYVAGRPVTSSDYAKGYGLMRPKDTFIQDGETYTIGGNVMPLRTPSNLQSFKDWSEAKMADMQRQGLHFSSFKADENAMRAAQDAGFSGVAGRNENNVVFDPRNIRSRFARFDPRLAHLKNLNAGVAGATAAGAGLLGYGDEANAATTAPLRADVTGAGNYSLGYEDTLGQLYRVDGGLMTPVGASADGITATPDRMEAPPEDQPEPWAIDEALRYYLGPTGIPERLAAVNEMLNPVRGMERAGEASSRMLDPDLGGLERTAAGADMLTEMLGAMLGFGGTKQAVQKAAPAVERGVLDIIDRLNQPGAMPTTYSNPIPGLLGRVEQNTALEDVLRAKYPGVKLSLTGDASKGYKLNQIIVPEEQRGSGVGSAIMRDIADAADQQGATVSLSPSADFGGSVGRLKEFYSRFGFVPNKGKSKDFAISESMYRLPKSDFPGLLPSAVSAPADEVAVRGSEIVDLLKSGRADEVTDAMLDMGDPVLNTRLNEYLWNNYDLPMDARSRAKRASEMGFETDAYHGGASDLRAMSQFEGAAEAGQGAIFSSSSPRVANTYAAPRNFADSGGNVTPLSLRSEGYAESGYTAPFPANGTQAEMDAWLAGVDQFNRKLDAGSAKNSYFTTQINAARTKNAPGAVIREVEDNRTAVGFVEPSDVFVSLDPTSLRSRFARFDPRLAHLKNLNAALAAGAPLGLLAMQPDEEY